MEKKYSIHSLRLTLNRASNGGILTESFQSIKQQSWLMFEGELIPDKFFFIKKHQNLPLINRATQ